MNSSEWFEACRKVVMDMTKKHVVEAGPVFLWILARCLADALDEPKTSFVLNSLKQESCNDLRQKFEIFDQCVDHRMRNDMLCLNRLDDIPQIAELESFYQEILGSGYKAKTGSFYTDQAMASFMVKQSLDDLIQNVRRSSCNIDYIDKIKSIRIADISCGSGVFLRECYRHLASLQTEVVDNHQEYTPWEVSTLHIFEKQLIGIEKEPEAAVLAEILIRLELPVRVQQHLKPSIFCEDGLLWEVSQQEKFDLIIGNPPYIGEKGNRNVFTYIKETEFGKHYYERSMDYFYYFIYRGSELLKEGGRLCYITTSYFATADGAKKLRKYIKEELKPKWMIQLGDMKVFHQAKGQHNLIYSLYKKTAEDSQVKILFPKAKEQAPDKFFKLLEENGIEGDIPGCSYRIFENANDIFDTRGQLLLKYSPIDKSVLDSIMKKTAYRLSDFCYINQGLVSGADKVTEKHREICPEWNKNKGIFVLQKQEVEALNLTEEEKQFLKPFHKNSDILPFRVRKREDQYILYITDKNMSKIEEYPSIYRHLERYRPILQNRREVYKNMRKWYSLHWPRKQTMFEKPKIVVPQRATYNMFAWSKDSWYASADVYYIQTKPEAWFSPLYLIGWLNSSLCYAWLSYFGKTKGNDLELYATPLKAVPVPTPKDSTSEEKVVTLVNDLIKEDNISDELRNDLWQQLDDFFLKWYDVSCEQGKAINKEAVKRRLDIRRRDWI
ncbi:adenine-specific DNA-methyltransferase [Tindallia magadiensis]|uniref:site-specific DNA-methyltransferase (adenine-specific) n=1 Tax=Tindallia magadiensis TaxID=69895 RepID=A0A1I3B6N1_9FIRM|nr:DNA methyltransferase [Tindallia magadiensis]SFH57870.1 adenine-specific DNA-methyltransferase [Tindallia magadiensis]